MTHQGTPKSMKEAIRRGLDGNILNQYPEHVVKQIENTVIDYLAQRFTPDLMSNPTVELLWIKIKNGVR